jgi:hemerythrin-like domain-containing protein
MTLCFHNFISIMPIFWDVTLCSQKKFTNILEEHNASIFKVKERTEQAKRKQKANYYQTIKRHIQEDNILYSHNCENLNSHNRLVWSSECNTLNCTVTIM